MTEDLGPAKTFFAFMDAVLASDLSSSQRLVLIVQAKHADASDGELTNSYPAEDTLARETGLSKDTIQRARKSLVELGWLVQTHSGRGGSSKWSNSYDLDIPDDAFSRPQGAALQNRVVPRQSRVVPDPKPHGAATSAPSSIPKSAPASTPPARAASNLIEGTKEDRGDSYWVGFSKKHPDGYFHRAEGSTRPKGNVVLVTLTGSEVRNIFGCYEYPQLLGVMLGYARAAGLRPPFGPSAVPGRNASARPSGALPGSDKVTDPARVLTRAERDDLYGIPRGFEVVRHYPAARAETEDDVIRRLIPSYR